MSGEYLKLLEGDDYRMNFVVFEGCWGREDMVYCLFFLQGPVHARFFACHCVSVYVQYVLSLSLCVSVCVCVCTCMCVVLDVDGAVFSCHHIHSRSQGADKALR